MYPTVQPVALAMFQIKPKGLWEPSNGSLTPLPCLAPSRKRCSTASRRNHATGRTKSRRLTGPRQRVWATIRDILTPFRARNSSRSRPAKAETSSGETSIERYSLTMHICPARRGRRMVTRHRTGRFMKGRRHSFRGRETPRSSNASDASLCTFLASRSSMR